MSDEVGTGQPGSSAQRPDTGLEPAQDAHRPADHTPAEPLAAGKARKGMFHIAGSGDTSGFGGLELPSYSPAQAERPYGGWFDEFVDDLLIAMGNRDIPADAIQQITVDRGEITLYLRREHLLAIAWAMRDEGALRFELLSSVSGVDYGVDVPQRLHSVYHFLSMTYRRRVRLEVALDVADPHLPSLVEVYPTADWQERETYDMFGVVFDGHPDMRRILMPEDFEGFPQRRDFPVGGEPVLFTYNEETGYGKDQ